MLYALMGLGLSLITGVLNIPNFAHGALFAVGAYFLVTVVGFLGNFWLGLLIAPIGVALLGLLIEWAGVRRLYSAGHDYQLLFTFGLALILNELIIVIWGPVGIRHLPPAIPLGGLGNLLGAIAAGLIIGIAQAVVAAYWTEASTAVIFAVMAAVLLVRPQGLFGIR